MSFLGIFGRTYSPDLLEDETTLRLLKMLVSGECVTVNVNALSRLLRRHRNTVRKQVQLLLEKNVVDSPICPFVGLYREYPLLVIIRADLPDEKPIRDWVVEDPHIIAAYWSRSAEYNMLLLTYHKDVLGYQLWRESLTEERKIPPRETRFPSNTIYVSNQLTAKYDPTAPITLLADEVKQKGNVPINGLGIDTELLEVLRLLVTGRVFKINENLLSRELGVHRKTVTKRVEQLLREQWILEPTCRFPDLLCPPNYVLVYSMIDIVKGKDRIRHALQNDPHVTMALRVSIGPYNAIVFSAHPDISEHMDWEQGLSARFPSCMGRVDVTYLSPRNKINIGQQYVSLCAIQNRLARARARKFRESTR